MRLHETFVPSSVAPSERSFELLPSGWYDAQVIETNYVQTKNRTGWIIECTWELINSPFGKRRVWDRVNVKNDSAKAQEIGQQRLKEMTEAMGVVQLDDTQQLQFIPCSIRVGVEHDQTGQYEDKNKVTGVARYGYRPGQGQTAGQAQPAQPAAAAPRPGNGIPGRLPGPVARPAPQAAQGAPQASTRPAAAPAAPPPRQAGPRPAGTLPWAR
jgi:uncharacterized protein DUF669